MKSIKPFLLLACFWVLSLMIHAQNARNMVIEYTTSTQCGGCPCLDW